MNKYAKYFALAAILISMGLMGFVIFQVSHAKKMFAARLISKSIEQSERELSHFFDRIHKMLYAIDQQYETGFWKGQDIRKLNLHFISLIQNFPSISSVGIADVRGYELNIIPDTAEGFWLNRTVFVDRLGLTEQWKRFKLNDSLILVDQWEKKLSIDPRKRPWFTGAVAAGGDVFWTRPYHYTTVPAVGITASLLVDPEIKEGPSTIIALDLTLDDLNHFVDNLQLTTHQNVFLLSGNNKRVIAWRINREIQPDLKSSGGLVTPQELGNPQLLAVLNAPENREAFRFELGGKEWWGILSSYNITDSRKINIVTVLPERDFALGIDQTLWVIFGSFLLIMILSFIVARSHNKLHKISKTLSEKNNLISRQKQVLFSEVHHRVKNNLALISAFMELDLLNTEDQSAGKNLRKNLHRIKIVAIIQEEAYKSQTLGEIPVGSLLSEIIVYLKESEGAAEADIAYTAENFNININQGLTFGLLLNELLKKMIDKDPASSVISLEIFPEQTMVHCRIKTNTVHQKEVLQSDIIKALSNQLDATITAKGGDEGTRSYLIRFLRKEKKGVAGSRYYRAQK